MSYLFLYVPISLVVWLVLETCRWDDPRKILARSLLNFTALTGALLLGSAFIYMINRYL